MGTESFDDTVGAVSALDKLFVMTRSAKGSVIVNGDSTIVQPATPVEAVVDTTGAGDAYCAGFLFGWADGRSLEECAKLGTLCGSAVIQQVGARIEPGALAGQL
jgi:adenosine kinase